VVSGQHFLGIRIFSTSEFSHKIRRIYTDYAQVFERYVMHFEYTLSHHID